jgi:hypothetical protein
MTMRALLLSVPLLAWQAGAQKIPDVSCKLEDYAIDQVTYWQATVKVGKVQVAVLRDPAGEQEARFDLMHGASLLSLRYRGKELLYGQSAGASVAMFAMQQPAGGAAAGGRGARPYRTMYSPDQGGSSFDIPATVAGVACNGQKSMRAYAVMVDRGVDNSFQKDALLGLWKGKISGNFPPGYATPFIIETNASWVENPAGTPRYYLKLDQSVVNVRPAPAAAFEWNLNAAAPWDFEQAANYPENCVEQTPCTSATAKALVAGRYQDAARTSGVATVVPTAQWRTGTTFIRPNAEYILLLYGAVWVAPRRVFGTVLEHPMEGSGAFQFSWYICAGGWDQARAFGDRQPAGTDAILPRGPLAPPVVVPDHDLVAVPAACPVTEFKMQPEQVDHAVKIEDPAGEQTVLFDTTQGGAIVSYKYRGVENVWGYNGGGLLQMAFHNGMTNGPWRGDYNPTQAGDGSAMSVVTGLACEGSSAIDLVTLMLDFNHNNAFYDKALISVWGGRVNNLLPPSYFSPYALETRARWVPNPSGTPKYYLRLDERIVHFADEKIGPVSFDFAYYGAWDLGVHAGAADTTFQAQGWYKDAAQTTGLAVARPRWAIEQQAPARAGGGGSVIGAMWRDRSVHLNARDTLDGITAKDFVWYVLAGTWNDVVSFAKTLK